MHARLSGERLTECDDTGERGRQRERSQPVHLHREPVLDPGREVLDRVDHRVLAEQRTDTILDPRQMVLVDAQADPLTPEDGPAVALVVRRRDVEDGVGGVGHILSRAHHTHERHLLGGAGRRGEVPLLFAGPGLFRGERDEREAVADLCVERVPHGLVDDELVRSALVSPPALDHEGRRCDRRPP